MKDIKEIEDTLKVSRSFALVSLYFFKSLETIRNSQDEKYSITIMENENLQRLFPNTVRYVFFLLNSIAIIINPSHLPTKLGILQLSLYSFFNLSSPLPLLQVQKTLTL